jgi:hypothetical protein
MPVPQPKGVKELQQKYKDLASAYRGIKCEPTLLSPGEAHQLLQTRVRNRPVSARTVAAYLEEILCGGWTLTNQAIGIDEDDHLYDGQHRCYAIFLSGVSVPVVIMRGLPTNAIEAVDLLRARTIYENRTLFRKENNARLISGYTSIAAQLIADGTHIVFRTVTAQERWRELAKDGIDWAVKTFDGDNILRTNRPGIAGALAFAHKLDPEAIEKFGVSLRTGAGLKVGSPALVLRNWVGAQIKKSPSFGGSYGRMNLVRVVLNAARAHVEGTKLKSAPKIDSTGIAFFRQAYNVPKVRNLVNRWREILNNSRKGYFELEQDPNVVDREALRPMRERVHDRELLAQAVNG